MTKPDPNVHRATPEDIPRPESIRDQLSRILGSRSFSNAPSLSRFLEFVVERSNGSRSGDLKEYLVGCEVFNRGESFNPQTDTIVRVQARRLRDKLDEYYRTEGLNDPVVIAIPKGGYTATFKPALGIPAFGNPASGRCVEIGASETPVVNAPLPAPRTSFIGREQELRWLHELLISDEIRLVTLSGPSGTGKTRLAVRLAQDLYSHFPGGVWFVSLAEVRDPADVPSEISASMRVPQTGLRSATDALKIHIQHAIRRPTLLIADNFEHLIPAASLLSQLLDCCPTLKILVTSRVVLHLYGEHDVSVQPLPVPDLRSLPPPDILAQNASVRLFLERSAAVRPGLNLTGANAAAIAEICFRLDGLPLAIELCAARTRILSPASMVVRLQSRLEFAIDGPRDFPERQQTLRQTIDWSHDLLDADQQKLFRRVAVFTGGFSLEAAEAVCNTHQELATDLTQALTALVDHSLIQPVGTDGEGELRFTMLESIREYGLARLISSGEEHEIRRAHAAYCLVIAEESIGQLEAERAGWMALCETEHDNMRFALGWLISKQEAAWALRLALGLFPFWESREYLLEARDFLEAVLAMPGNTPRTANRAVGLCYLGVILTFVNDLERARALEEEGLQICRELGDKKGETSQLQAVACFERFIGNWSAARALSEQIVRSCRELGSPPHLAAALSNLADVVSEQGDDVLARALLDEAMEIFRQLKDWTGLGWSYNHLGDVARLAGDLAHARRMYTDALKIFEDHNDFWGYARTTGDLGVLAREEGDLLRAYEYFAESLKLFLSLEHNRGIARALEDLACLAAQQHHYARSLTLAGAAAALRHRTGAAARTKERRKVDDNLGGAWNGVNPADGVSIWTTGYEMPFQDAVRLALSESDSEGGSSILRTAATRLTGAPVRRRCS